MTSAGVNCRLVAASCLALATLAVGVGCGASEGDTVDPESGNEDSALTLDQAKKPLADASPELAAIRDQANEILDEGTGGYDSRLAELSGAGIPVVVNNWASWCGPCRGEFPEFQEAAIKHEDDVAFIGLLSGDGPETGATFLSELPIPYPSYLDSDYEVSRDLGIRGLPGTIFYGSDGEVAYTKFGPYESFSDLEADIEKYAQ